MKKILIFLTLITLLFLASLQFRHEILQPLKNKISSEEPVVNYWHKMHKDAKFSLNPAGSDSYNNLVLMYQVVGTLLRNGKSGNYEPYLAESWQMAKDGSYVKFKLKKNIFTASGFSINALSYSDSLHRIFKILGKEGSLVQFDSLIGMDKFLKGMASTIEGIKADDDTISFSFTGPTDDLLITFTEPYFGFYSPLNFNKNGQWKDDRYLDSSGMYFITNSFNNFRSVSIEKNQSYAGNKGPQKINLHYYSLNDEISWKEGSNIIYGAMDIDLQNIPIGYATIKSDPNMLGALVLSPYLEPFKSIENRKAILNLFFNNFLSKDLKSNRAQKSIHFNFLDKPSFDVSSVIKKNHTEIQSNARSIKFAYYNLAPSEIRYLKLIFEEIEQKSNIKIEMEEINRGNPEVSNKFFSNKFFEMRFVTVVVGGSSSNQNNIMMFCSKLGVNFPDPSNRLCALFSKYEKNGGKIDENYIDRFHQFLYEDASVIPIFHAGFSWLVSDNLNATVLTTGFGMPRFDLVLVN